MKDRIRMVRDEGSKTEHPFVLISDPSEVDAIMNRKFRDDWPTWRRIAGGIWAKIDEVLKAWRAARAAKNRGTVK